MRYIFFLVALFIMTVSPFYGQIDINLSNIFDKNSTDYQIFWDIRVPRVLLSFFVGSILSLSGLVFQTVFKNPMSSPFTLGVASAATLFSAIAIVLGLSLYISLFAFLGAVFTIVILFGISSKLSFFSTSSLLLIGIALSFFYNASLMVLFFLSDLQESYEIVRFTMGSLDIVGFLDLYPVVTASLALYFIVLKQKQNIKLLLTSNEFALSKGINLKKTNHILLFSVSLAVGICVSIAGPVGFVGLIIPHIIKMILKKSADQLIGYIFFYGGVFLVFCDLVSRTISTTSDIPIGVITSFLGAPFFIYLVIRR